MELTVNETAWKSWKVPSPSIIIITFIISIFLVFNSFKKIKMKYFDLNLKTTIKQVKFPVEYAAVQS